jgi:hypothetical protein
MSNIKDIAPTRRIFYKKEASDIPRSVEDLSISALQNKKS